MRNFKKKAWFGLAAAFVFSPLSFGKHTTLSFSAVLFAEDIDELQEQVIILPNGNTATVLKYADRNWRKVDSTEILTGNDVNDLEVCFEGKFFGAIKPDKLKLFGATKVAIAVDEPEKFKIASQLKLGDNLRLFGTLRYAKDGKGVEFSVIEMQKRPTDELIYEGEISRLEKKGDADGLKHLGNKIKQQIADPNAGIAFALFDKLTILMNKAYSLSLNIREAKLKPDDADGLFALAEQWRDLLQRNNRFHELVMKCLHVDPDHEKAVNIAQTEFDLVRRGKDWITKEQNEIQDADDKKAVADKQRAVQDAQNQFLKNQLRMAAERPALLFKAQMSLRVADPKARERALMKFGDDIQKSTDPGFGEQGIDILVNLSDKSAVSAALESAGKSQQSDVRKLAYEALAWRGAQDDQALTVLAAALETEKEQGPAKSGVDALIALGGPDGTNNRGAVRTLIASLKTPNSTVQSEIIEGLKSLARQPLSNKEDWEKWWNENKTFK